MPIRTRSSASESSSLLLADEGDEGETNWAEAAAAAAVVDNNPEVAALALDDGFPTQEQREEEDWLNTIIQASGGNDDDYDDRDDDDNNDANNDGDVNDDVDGNGNGNGNDNEDDELIAVHRDTENVQRTPWILQVAIPNGAATKDNNIRGDLANIYIDTGMTAERLGRCIVQAVSLSSPSSPLTHYATRERHFLEYDDDRSRNFSIGALVGLFGKQDGVLYSLECILAMKPADGEGRIFCVTKPVHPVIATTSTNNDANDDKDNGNLSFVLSYITTRNSILGAAVLVLSLWITPGVINSLDNWRLFVFNHIVDNWRLFVSSLWLLIPSDLPSMWQIVSRILDWPAREIYRYGPSAVGWEGRDLIDICSQMNRRYYFVGLGLGNAAAGNDYEDREYWRQNPRVCETIYRMKEEGFVRMCRPLWYIAVIAVSFVAIQRLVAAAFAKNPPPRLNRTDRAVLDTYRAIQILLREHLRQEGREQQR